jgi:hypothetical protein
VALVGMVRGAGADVRAGMSLLFGWAATNRTEQIMAVALVEDVRERGDRAWRWWASWVQWECARP